MRLFKLMLVLAAVLDLAMFLQSPTTPLTTRTPTQVVGFSADNTNADAALHGVRF